MNNVKTILTVIALLVLSSDFSLAQIGRLRLSPLQESSIKIGTTDINLSFSRPSRKGRKIFGELVAYNKWWRTGANRNTTIAFNEDVIIGEERVEKGKYAIFTKPSKTTWEVIFYKKTDNWDVPEIIDSSQIVSRIMVNPEELASPMEVLNITIPEFNNYGFDLKIEWESTFIKIPIKLTTAEIMEQKISRALNGPIAHDYYAAARYEIESGKNYSRGLEWIDMAIQSREATSWWDLRIKSLLLNELNRQDEAAELASKALSLAKKENHEYGINEMSRILNSIKK